MSTKKQMVTKRQVLKISASVYDPLGLFTPVTLRAKLMLQSLWKEGLEWDDELSVERIDVWKNIETDLKKISEVKVPRYIGNGTCQLLCFCDASAKAYSACIYLRCLKDGEVSTNLIFSKSRVAPEKVVTLPRLELLGVLIGIRCLDFIRKHWRYPVEREI